MRVRTKSVTFTRPFRLTGLEGVQPAGTYTIETEEELLPTWLSSAFKRGPTWIVLPAQAVKSGTTQCIAVDPNDLETALRHDIATAWTRSGEAAIDDYLRGDVMTLAMNSSGLTSLELKEQLRKLSWRLAPHPTPVRD